MGIKVSKPLRRSGFEGFFRRENFFKKSVDKRVGLCYNHQRCRENSKRAERATTAILENDTEKSHFVQEIMTQERLTAR